MVNVWNIHNLTYLKYLFFSLSNYDKWYKYSKNFSTYLCKYLSAYVLLFNNFHCVLVFLYILIYKHNSTHKMAFQFTLWTQAALILNMSVKKLFFVFFFYLSDFILWSEFLKQHIQIYVLCTCQVIVLKYFLFVQIFENHWVDDIIITSGVFTANQ